VPAPCFETPPTAAPQHEAYSSGRLGKPHPEEAQRAVSKDEVSQSPTRVPEAARLAMPVCMPSSLSSPGKGRSPADPGIQNSLSARRGSPDLRFAASGDDSEGGRCSGGRQ